MKDIKSSFLRNKWSSIDLLRTQSSSVLVQQTFIRDFFTNGLRKKEADQSLLNVHSTRI